MGIHAKDGENGLNDFIEANGVPEVAPKKENYFTKTKPTVMTDDVLLKLEQAYALGCTDNEACFYAGIARSTLYNYQQTHPDFVERKEELKSKPVLLSRQTVLKGITGHEVKDSKGNVVEVVKPNTSLAFAFLKSKKYDEFKDGLEVNTDGKIEEYKAMMLRFASSRGEKYQDNPEASLQDTLNKETDSPEANPEASQEPEISPNSNEGVKPVQSAE